MTDEAKTVDVLIVAGPHAGMTHPYAECDFSKAGGNIPGTFELVYDPGRGWGVARRIKYCVWDLSITDDHGIHGGYMIATPADDKRSPAAVGLAYLMTVALDKARDDPWGDD